MAERPGNKGSGGRAAGERSPRKPATEGRDEARADKSVQAFREALEKSVMLSRDRLQEVVDDAVSRGRITRDDANELVSRLVARGRQQTDSLLRDLERLLGQARDRLR
jgi:polyhydroxyalkanoate synthesis regulator phasin